MRRPLLHDVLSRSLERRIQAVPLATTKILCRIRTIRFMEGNATICLLMYTESLQSKADFTERNQCLRTGTLNGVCLQRDVLHKTKFICLRRNFFL